MPRARKRRIGGNSAPITFSIDTETSDDSDNVHSLSQLPSLPKNPRQTLFLRPIQNSAPAVIQGDVQSQSPHASSPSITNSPPVVIEGPISNVDDRDSAHSSGEENVEDGGSARSSGEENVADQDIGQSSSDEDIADQNINIEMDSDDILENDFNPDLHDYNTIFTKLKRDWLSVELSHKVSKACSNDFWKLALERMHPLLQSKKDQKIKYKVPQFQHIRKQLYDELAPEVQIEIAYREKKTGIVHIVTDTKTNIRQFPPNEYVKLYEIGTVDPEDMLRIHSEKCKVQEKKVLLSLDGVSESKSTSVSMDVFSTKFKSCRAIYPNRIVRPLGRVKKNNSDEMKILLDLMEKNAIEIAKIIADNPKRSILRCSLSHSAYYPCEYCFAKGLKKNTSKTESQLKNEEKRYMDQKKIITEKIDAVLNSEEEGENRDLKISLLQSLQEDLEKPRVSNKTQIVWPAATRNCEKRTKAAIIAIIERIESGEILTKDEAKGIVGRSELLSIDHFDYVNDLPAEYMHCSCLGMVKRLTELTFQVGTNRKRITKRKLTPVASFNMKIRMVKFMHEFSRRARDLDFAVMKAQEFRNLALFFVPVVIDCLESDAEERKLWLLLWYMLRSCTVPNEEFANIPVESIKLCMETFYNLYERLFGEINCSYSVHVVCCHLLDMRGEDPLTETSAFSFESFYGEVRNCFTPGSVSPLKQILQNIYMKRILSNHLCYNPVTVTAYDTPLESNSMVYTYSSATYNFYKVIDIQGDELTCYKQGKYKSETAELSTVDWSLVGVFLKGGILKEETKINLKNVKGKVINVQEYLITVPNNVLREK